MNTSRVVANRSAVALGGIGTAVDVAVRVGDGTAVAVSVGEGSGVLEGRGVAVGRASAVPVAATAVSGTWARAVAVASAAAIVAMAAVWVASTAPRVMVVIGVTRGTTTAVDGTGDTRGPVGSTGVVGTCAVGVAGTWTAAAVPDVPSRMTAAEVKSNTSNWVSRCITPPGHSERYRCS
jgi:hypothetical protein